jgi:hypothetical protein
MPAMPATLPAYNPPSGQRASVAAGVAPLLVLLTFVLIVARAIDVDTGLASFLACAVWVVVEMDGYQRAIDSYNAGFVESHLAWRSSDTLREWTRVAEADPATREFVQRFLDSERVLLRDGQQP